MTNAEIIATTLDGLLDHEVSLVVYGRAALALGFEHVSDAVGRSLDLDVILRFSDAASIEGDDQFWSAQQQLNQTLESSGLYLTHIFFKRTKCSSAPIGRSTSNQFYGPPRAG